MTTDNNEVATRWQIKISEDDGITPYLWDNRKLDNYDLGTLCRILNEYEEKANRIEELKEEVQFLKSTISKLPAATPSREWHRRNNKILLK